MDQMNLWKENGMKKTISGVVLGIVFLFLLLFYQGEKNEEEAQQIHMVSGNRVLQEGEEAPQLSLYALSATVGVADENGYRLLYGKEEEIPLPMASTTKIMTCILALEYGDLNSTARVSAYAASQPKVDAGLLEGEEYRLEDLLYSLMLESHNDTAVVIAEHIGGSVEGFARLMNEKAREIGINEAYFITPNGLDAQDGGGVHSISAKDLTRLSAYAMENEAFMNIINTSSYSFTDVTGHHGIYLQNANAFLDRNSMAVGIKTGYTNDAGYCFAGAIQWEGRLLVSAVLGSGWPPNRGYKWSDTERLFDYVIENYSMETIALEEICVTLFETEEQKAFLWASELELNYLLSAYDRLEVEVFCPSALEPTGLSEGDCLGYRRILLNETEIYRQTLYYREIEK